ncbi:MAG: SCO family protein [Pseudomonadales bacterium]|nr:SCO family protein [Pseudomonadales bacterium]
MTEEIEIKKKKRRLNPLTVMVVLFGFPYIISWYMFYSGDSLFFKEGKSQGVLVSPVREIPEFETVDIAGNKVSRQLLQGKWSFLVVGPSKCDELCNETIVMLRQVRRAQAVGRKRVQRLWLLTENTHKAELNILIEDEHQGLNILMHSPQASQILYPVLNPENSTIEDFSIFLIDPLGNLMMYYEPRTEGKKVLKDLKHLLKYSELGE